MERRKFIKHTAAWGLALHPLSLTLTRKICFQSPAHHWKISGPAAPVFIYNNWSAYDELSDNVAQTETLAMLELDQVIRLKKMGVEIDYYVMDAFWFDKWGGYRTWHKTHWPNGPDKWLADCKANQLKPGMWFSTNLIATRSGRFLEVIPEWQDSLGTDTNIMCMFQGGYLHHLSESLQSWYDRGVRLFKFDFAYFEAITPGAKDKYSKEEVLEKNKLAFMQMLQAMREKNPDILITGYNGFGGDMENTFSPLDKKIDPRWLDTFDTLYSGDPRFSDVPMMNIWRSQDNYSDHQVTAFKAYGLPIRRIDNCAFMIGQTGTCYYRGRHCWKGMLILELARGGWVNVFHGNLELLSDEDARWFAKVQSLYHRLQRQDSTNLFGAIPGRGEPYGFYASTPRGAVFTVVNPAQRISKVTLPMESAIATQVMYSDDGFSPMLSGKELTLGPEQLVVVGSGEFADSFENRFNLLYNLGTDESIQIPLTIEEIPADFVSTSKNTIEASVIPEKGRHLRILFQQFDASGWPYRSWPGAPPDGKKVDAYLKIAGVQQGKKVPLHIEYDKMIWSGLSWGAAEIHSADLDFNQPLRIICSSAENETLTLKTRLYAVTYKI
jgi:hypothetical protein